MNRPLLFGLLVTASAAQAQATFSIGPTLGGALSTVHTTSEPTVRYRLDWLAGVQASAAWGKFAVQPALLISQKGFRTEDEVTYRPTNNQPPVTVTLRNNVRLSYLTLPVNLCFAPLGTASGPQLFAGPYVSVLLGGRNVHTDIDNPASDATATDRVTVAEQLEITSGYGARRFDAGLQGGFGYRYHAFQLQASYSLGLRTSSPVYTYRGVPITSAGSYNRAFCLALAYLFGTK